MTTRYNTDGLHTGQTVLVAARGFWGVLIAAVTAKFRALWSTVRTHAGTLIAEKWIKYWWDRGTLNVRPQHVAYLRDRPDPERWWVFEAKADGLWLRPLDEILGEGYRLMIREVPPDFPPAPLPEWKENLASFVARASGVWKYNYKGILDCFLYEILGAPSLNPAWVMALSEDDLLTRVKTFICSSLDAFLKLRFRGVSVCPGLAVRATAPDDEAAGPPKCILVTVVDELKIVGNVTGA